MTGKLSVILTVVMLGTIVLVACSPAAPAAPTEMPPAPTLAAPTEMPPAPTPVICGGNQSCFQPQFLACASSELTIPFGEGTTYLITVFGKENGLCHYALAMVDENGNTPAGGPPSADCRVPMEKITQDTFGHFFGQDAAPGQESIKAEQDKIASDYCVTGYPSSTANAEQPSKTEPALNKVTCAENDMGCIFTNVFDKFKNGCQPVEVGVSLTTDDGTQVPPFTITISSGENGACHLQLKGLGPDQDCLFAKENVTEYVVKGMFNADNIQNDPEFQEIKAASCK